MRTSIWRWHHLGMVSFHDMPRLKKTFVMTMEFHLGLPMKPYYDTNVYEDEYLSFHKLSLSANTIIDNMFAQIDDKGD